MKRYNKREITFSGTVSKCPVKDEKLKDQTNLSSILRL